MELHFLIFWRILTMEQLMPPKRKVALFSTSFLPYSQTFIHDEIKAHSDDYEITVFCKDRQNEDIFPFDNYYKPKGKLAEKIYQNIAYWPKFDKIFEKEKFDLVHAHFGTGAVYALPYVKKYKIPFVVTFHGNDVAALVGTQKFQVNRWRYYLKHKEIFKHATLLLAASEELKALLIELGAPASKVQVYRLGIDLSNFRYLKKSSNKIIEFIMVGRFTPKKGHLYTLNAFKEVIEDRHQAKLTFIGSGELLSDAKEFVDANGLSKFVDFRGILTSDEVIQSLEKADVLIAPSVVAHDQDRESGLIVVKEASSIGLPVIGTWHGGIHEIIDDNVTGFLVPERNIPQLVDKMTTLIKNPELICQFGKAGRQKMESDYDLFEQVKKLEELYEKAISDSEL